VLCVIDCCLSFCHFSFGLCIPVVLRFTTSHYPLGICKLFFPFLFNFCSFTFNFSRQCFNLICRKSHMFHLETNLRTAPTWFLVCVFSALFIFELCLVYPMLPVSLDYPFLIAPLVFSSVYLIALL